MRTNPTTHGCWALLIAAACMAVTLLPQDALAKRGFRGGGARGGDGNEQLLFVSETSMTTGSGEALSLCKLVVTHSFWFVNFGRSAESYGLATDGCETNAWYQLQGEELQAARSDRRIATFPEGEPTLTLAETATGHWGWALAVLVIGAYGRTTLQRRQRRKTREAALGDQPNSANRILDAMCHVAIADGVVDDAEVRFIQQTARQLSGVELSEDKVREAIANASRSPSDEEFREFAKGMSSEERKRIFKAAFMVACVDGQLDGVEKTFVGKLAGSLGLKQPDIDEIIQSLKNSAAPA